MTTTSSDDRPDRDGAIRPAHYKKNPGDIECIDAMRQIATPEEFQGFCKLSAFKYIWRCGDKDVESQEVEKAITYLGWHKESLEGQGR